MQIPFLYSSGGISNVAARRRYRNDVSSAPLSANLMTTAFTSIWAKQLACSQRLQRNQQTSSYPARYASALTVIEPNAQCTPDGFHPMPIKPLPKYWMNWPIGASFCAFPGHTPHTRQASRQIVMVMSWCGDIGYFSNVKRMIP